MLLRMDLLEFVLRIVRLEVRTEPEPELEQLEVRAVVC